MSILATVTESGTIVLPPEAKLLPGTQVHVVPVDDRQDKRPIGQKLAEMAGVIKDWPSDFAENHDHYIHGTPKRTRS